MADEKRSPKIRFVIDNFEEKLGSKKPFNHGEHEATSRLEITKLFLWWFFILIAGAFIFGGTYNFIAAHLNMHLIPAGKVQLEYLNIVDTVSVVTTTLSGSVGFVIGFYFKNKLDKE